MSRDLPDKIQMETDANPYLYLFFCSQATRSLGSSSSGNWGALQKR